MTPSTTTTPKTDEISLESSKTGFDLNSKSDVQLRKVGTDTPIANMQDFLTRMDNNNAAIMALIQKAYTSLVAEKLANDPNVPWQLVTTDEAGKETLGAFDGFLLDGDKLKNFNLTVLGAAKSFFGYPDEKPAKGASDATVKAWQDAKKAAVESARDMFLSNPAAVAALKK